MVWELSRVVAFSSPFFLCKYPVPCPSVNCLNSSIPHLFRLPVSFCNPVNRSVSFIPQNMYAFHAYVAPSFVEIIIVTAIALLPCVVLYENFTFLFCQTYFPLSYLLASMQSHYFPFVMPICFSANSAARRYAKACLELPCSISTFCKNSSSFPKKHPHFTEIPHHLSL